MKCCPTCGRPPSRRGTQAAPTMRRVITCWSCHEPFTQVGPGRRRITCDKPECLAKRAAYRRRGEADLDHDDHLGEASSFTVTDRILRSAESRSAHRRPA